MLYLIDVSGESDEPAALRRASAAIKARIASDYGETIIYNQGRPSLTKHDFNITHHFPLCLAIATDQRVGIYLTYGNSPPSFTQDQFRLLFAPVPANELEFLLCWAAREAYLKFTGEGFREQAVAVEIPSGSICDLESESFIPLTVTVEKTDVHCFRLRGLIGAAVCPPHELSHRHLVELVSREQ